ncbi:tripartite tricarboxylate transporter substrate binding protein [Brevibacillus sp. NRS-1366]|uniref:tripartite tricarboxylate transporter substrate binding protein n=1 Tax=Brevibacillus sp. NRS-1366 TaxID=3233899 RepID=UPI003D1DE8FD
MRSRGNVSFLLIYLSLLLLVFGCSPSSQSTTDPSSITTTPAAKVEEGEPYPNGPIEMIVGFGAGGGTDTMARTIQPKFQEILGVPVAVRNMPGASSALAIEHVQKQQADGQTILFQTDLIRVFPTMGMTDYTYKDFEQIGIGAMGIATFTVKKDSAIKTFSDLVTLLQTGKAKVGVAGIGDPWHLTLEIVKNTVGGKAEIITYDSGKNAAMAALRNEVDFSISGVNEVVDLLRAGELRALAVMDNKPFQVKGIGSIPPVTDFEGKLAAHVPEGTWWGPSVKAGTPQPIINKLRDAYRRIIQTEEFKKFAEERAIVLITIEDPQEYTRKITEKTSWLLWDIGVGKRSPEEVGILRP